jgi:hypothetical protein
MALITIEKNPSGEYKGTVGFSICASLVGRVYMLWLKLSRKPSSAPK